MTSATPRRLWAYVCPQLRLEAYRRRPGDGRPRPQIPATALLWALVIGHVLREWSFHGVEALVRSPARRALRVSRRFGDDALAYFTERLEAAPTRAALAAIVRRAKRNNAFGATRYIGVAIDGTGVGRCHAQGCGLCHAVRDTHGTVFGYVHHFALISVVGVGVSLPFDVEPYGPGDCEYVAGQRLLQRAMAQVGPRFADYVVGRRRIRHRPLSACRGRPGAPRRGAPEGQPARVGGRRAGAVPCPGADAHARPGAGAD